MKKNLLFVILALFSCTNTAYNDHSPKAINGILDLRNRDFAKSGNLELSGAWEFYWSKFLTPTDFRIIDKQGTSSPDTRDYIKVPAYWNDLNVAEKGAAEKHIAGAGYATYRLKLLTSQVDGLSLYLQTMGTAYVLYVNGTLATKVGQIGMTPEQSKPEYNVHVVRLPASTSGNYEIIIQISNFNYKQGGIWYPITFGNDRDINKAREKNLFVDLFLVGSLFIMGIYHLGLFLFRRKDRSALWFGLICLLISIRNMVISECYLFTLYPGLPFDLGVKLDYSTFFLSIPFFHLFLKELFPKYTPKIIFYFIQGLSYLFLIPVIIFPPQVFTHTAIVMEMAAMLLIGTAYYSLIRSAIDREDGAIFFLAGTFILMITVINDILHTSLIINTGYYISFGLFIFIFSQALFLSKRFASAFIQVEELSANLEHKVSERTKQLELAKIKAEEANNLKDKFVGLISHDLRSPISGANGLIQLVLEMDDSRPKKEIDELLLLSEKSLSHTLKMIEQVLDLTRIRSGKILPIFEKTGLGSILPAVIDEISPKANEKGVRIINSIADDANLITDPTLLGQVLLNLLNNAVKFTRPNDFIEIKYSLKDKQHVIELTDSGIGISEKYLPNLFNSSVQTTTKGTSGETGTGLGLPLCRELIESMHGEISAGSEPGKGSTFTITVPAFEKVILVVDDNEILRKEMVYLLRHEKAFIQEAENGEIALKVMNKLKPDLIISDNNMPVMDGFVMIQKIRANPDWKNIPIIVATSGKWDESTHLEMSSELLLTIGANEVIIKPVQQDKFIDLLKKYSKSDPGS